MAAGLGRGAADLIGELLSLLGYRRRYYLPLLIPLSQFVDNYIFFCFCL